MSTEREHAETLQAASNTLRDAGFSEADLRELFGTGRSRNLLVERAERVLRNAGCDAAILGTGGELYSGSEMSSADAETSLLQVLKIALGMAADSHNLLTHRIPPTLPDALEEITRNAPPVIAASIEDALNGYEALFDYPTISHISAAEISKLRLTAVRARLSGKTNSVIDYLQGWAARKGLPIPQSNGACLQMLRRESTRSDAAFVEAVGIALESEGDVSGARTLFGVAGVLRDTAAPDR